MRPKPAHPERCPECGKPTWNWYYLSTRIWVECEHCGFQGRTSNTPVGGAATDSESRRMPVKT
jgi:ribosomal protein L37AE/L43A